MHFIVLNSDGHREAVVEAADFDVAVAIMNDRLSEQNCVLVVCEDAEGLDIFQFLSVSSQEIGQLQSTKFVGSARVVRDAKIHRMNGLHKETDRSQ